MRVVAVVFAILTLSGACRCGAWSERDFAEEYHVRKWQVEDGLPQNTVYFITQTSDGYLWIATQDALARFDGRQFKTIYRASIPSLENRLIRCLYGDRAGRLWIGSDERLVCFAEGEFTVYAPPEGVKMGEFNGFGEDSSGRLYALGWLGFCRVDLDRAELTPLFNAFGPNGGSRMAADRSGCLWIASGNSLYRFADNQWSLSATLPFIVSSLWLDSDDTLWCGLIGGEIVRIDSRGSQQRFKVGEGGMYALIRSDRSGMLFRMEHSFGRLSPTELIQVPLPSGKTVDRIHDLYKDREGNIWLGTEGDGLVMLRWNPLRAYSVEHGLRHSHVTTVAETREGRACLGTMGGGLVTLEEGRWRELKLPVWPNISSLLETREGALWVGTFGRHVWRFDKNGAHLETKSRALAARALFEDRGGGLWIGGDGMGVECLKEGRVARFDTGSGLLTDHTRCFAQDWTGAVWVGTERGLYRIRDQQVEGFFADAGLRAGTIHALFVDSQGSLWIGAGGGLTRYRGDRFVTATHQHGLPDSLVAQILEDEFGFLWLGTSRGLFRARLAALNAVLDGEAKRIFGRSFGKAEGMRNLECTRGFQPNCMKGSDGRLWFTTVDGAVVIDPKNIPQDHVPPSVHIQRFLADGTVLALDGQPVEKISELAARPTSGHGRQGKRRVPGGVISVPPGAKRLEFQYAGISFSAPDQVRFQRKLEGYDKEWNDPDAQTSASYTKVPPGSYVFRVLAANADGLWSPEVAELAFVVQPALWQTWWFRSAAVFVAGGIVFAFTYGPIHRRRQIERLRLRIARDLHDEVGSNLGTIALYNQLAKAKEADPGPKSEFDEIDRVVQRTAQSLRDVIWFTNPEFDTVSGMLEHMEDSATRTLAGKALSFETGPVIATRRLAVEFRRNFFFMYRELLHNILKHAHATRVQIYVAEEKNTLVLRVSDNGVGFDPGAGSAGNGLRNMKQRAAEMEGTVEIVSRPQGGTTVCIRAPLHSR